MSEKEKEEIIEQEVKEIEENGIKIADDVVATIAGKAALEVKGVFSMAGGFAGGISEVFGKKTLIFTIICMLRIFLLMEIFIQIVT